MLKPASYRALTWLLVALLSSAAVRADYLEVGAPNGTGNLVVSAASPLTYNIGVTTAGGGQSITIGNVLLTIDRGSQTTAPVVIDVFSAFGGASGTGSIIASTTIPYTSISASSFGTVSSLFASAVPLPASGYSVRVSTTSPGTASDKYQIKTGPLKLFTSGSALVSSYYWVEDQNGTGTASTSLVASGTVLAQYALGTNAYGFGNYRVGTTLSATTTLVNTAFVTSNNVTQALAVSGTSISGGVNSLAGLPSPYLSVGGTSNVVTGLNSSITGPNSGTAALTFSSVSGTSATTGTSAIGSGTLALSGTGYNWANAKVSSGTLAFGNVRTGSAAPTQTVAVGNQTVVNGSFQDLLNVSGSTSNAAVSATGFSNLAASTSGATTSNVSLAANTATAGNLASTVSLTYASNANGVAGLSNGVATIVGGTAPTITTTGGVYDYAQATYSGTTFAFGYIHRGGAAASGTAAIGNQTVSNASYQDSLNASATTGNPLVSASGFTGLAPSAGGGTTNNLVVSIGTGTAGSLASTVALSLVSNANGVAGLSNGPAAVVGSPGSITTTGTVFTGQSTWNVNGGGQWGTLASNFGSNWNWSTFDGSPGVDPSFTNTDTATFGSAVTSGTATVTVTAATPSVKSVTFDNSAASYALTGASGGSLALLNAGTSAASVTVTAGLHSMALPVSLGSNASLDVASGSLLTMAGVVSGSRNLAKTGSGTTILSGNNSYGGTTTVAGGKLLIHGDQTAATGAITVESGATLGGRGAAGGAITVLAGGTLSPGASVESLAAGATTLSGSSTFFYEVDSSAALSAGADLLTANGNLTIANGSILEFLDLASSPTAFAQGTKFSLISYGSNAWNGGLFTFSGNQLSDGETFSAGLNQWEIDYNDPTGGSNFTSDQLVGSSVTITAVPEPASIAILASGLLACSFAAHRLNRRRRSRQ